jgi:hypothetical protein
MLCYFYQLPKAFPSRLGVVVKPRGADGDTERGGLPGTAGYIEKMEINEDISMKNQFDERKKARCYEPSVVDSCHNATGTEWVWWRRQWCSRSFDRILFPFHALVLAGRTSQATMVSLSTIQHISMRSCGGGTKLFSYSGYCNLNH